MTTIVLGGYGLLPLLAFGLRGWLHWRQTGTTGFVPGIGRVLA